VAEFWKIMTQWVIIIGQPHQAKSSFHPFIFVGRSFCAAAKQDKIHTGAVYSTYLTIILRDLKGLDVAKDLIHSL
jgi:hypothetical protein